METDIKKLIEDFLQKTNLDFSNLVGELDMDSGYFTFSVESKDAHLLTGKDGEGFFAINSLIKRMLENKYKENTPKVSLDINNYQKAKIDKIKTMAHMMSERARFFKSKIELEPMNAFERRVVHEYVSKQSDLVSESEGYGKDRKIVISYKK